MCISMAKVLWEGEYVFPSGNAGHAHGGGILENTGAIDGVKLSGQSSLTGGKVMLIGLRRMP